MVNHKAKHVLKRLLILLVMTVCAHGATVPWRAQWIWLPETDTGEMLLARKTFALSEVPSRARLAITASSHYALYINGRYVARGPARCAPHHQSFDRLDIAQALRRGRNVLALRVHFQRDTVAFYDAARGGLLAQLDGVPEPIQTDATWRVTPDPSRHSEAPAMARFHLELCDRVDLRKQPKGWSLPEFNDRTWARARVLKRETGWPSPQKNERPTHLIPPWTTLVERDIPYLKETVVTAGQPVHVGRMRASDDGGDWVTLPVIPRIEVSGRPGAGKRVAANTQDECRVLVFDLGEVRNGRPYLDIEAPTGTVVDIMAAPYLLDRQLLSRVVDSTYVDRIVLSGRREHWEAFYWKPVRWLALVFRRLSGEAVLHDSGVVLSAYPFERKGSLHLPEAPGLQALWEAGARTVTVCTTDAYTDNYRERRQYAQTAYYACLGSYPVFGDTALQRRYLLQIAQEQLPNGIMPAYAPRHGNDFMVILDSNCFWLRGLRQYLLYSGDVDTARVLLPAARRLLDLLHGFTNTQGLIDSPPYPYWLDHAVNDRRGANFCLNGHYLGALEDMAQVLDWLQEPDSRACQGRADRIRAALQTHCWDQQRGLFADAWVNGARSGLFSEHANALALALDVATPDQARSVARHLLSEDAHDFIRRASGLTMVTPAMSYYLHAGLCRQGYVGESLDLLQARFKHMLAPDTNGTLWEEWWLDGTGRTGKLDKRKTRSDAQTESAFVPSLLTEFVLGVRPTRPGLKEVTLCRSDAGLRTVAGAIPSPEGVLQLRWQFNEGSGGELRLTVPGDMRVKLDLASLGLGTVRPVFVNGQPYEPANEGATHLILTRGKHQVQF